MLIAIEGWIESNNTTLIRGNIREEVSLNYINVFDSQSYFNLFVSRLLTISLIGKGGRKCLSGRYL